MPRTKLISTTCASWRQPILGVDDNNNPSRLVEYDGFGRQVKWWKIDKSDPSNRVLVMQKKYVASGENISILNPIGGETFYKTMPMDIKWSYAKPGAMINIYCKLPSGTLYPIATGVNAGLGLYTWTIPTAIDTEKIINNCIIKIVDALDPKNYFDYSKPFTIASSAVFSPLGGSKWPETSNMEIKWVLAGALNVKVFYYSSSTDINPIIITSSTNNGEMTYQWRIPIAVRPTNQAFIRVVDQGNSSNFVDSGVFTIIKASSFIRRFFGEL